MSSALKLPQPEAPESGATPDPSSNKPKAAPEASKKKSSAGGGLRGSLRKTWPILLICFVVTAVTGAVLYEHYGYQGREDLLYAVESRLFDMKLRARGPLKDPTKVAILAIDEKSLDQFGRWPFSRRYYAKAFENLKKAGVAWIGFDMVWAEPETAGLQDALSLLEQDGSSEQVLKRSEMESLLAVSPADQVAAAAVAEFTNVILGFFYFGYQVEADLNLQGREPFRGLDLMEGSAVMLVDIPEGLELSDYHRLSRGYGIVGNTPFHSQASEYFAFFSNNADDDAINRWVTLIADINGQLMPSLALKSAAEHLNSEILVIFDDTGVDSIELISRDTEEVIRKIPLDTQGRGRLLVNHRGPSHGFEHVSLLDAYNDSFSDEQRAALKDSVLLLGATATGINDIRPNPFDPVIDGVENHAAALDNILKQDYMKRPADIILTEFMIILGIFLLFTPLLMWGKAITSAVALVVVLCGYFYVDSVVWFGRGIWAFLFLPISQIVLMFVLANLFKYLSEEKDKKFLKSAFGSYISPELIDEMYSSGEPPQLGGTSGILSAYFTDIQSFSSFSEQLTATQLVELLNEYLTAMTDILLEEKGTLDKYEGDAIIAFFGAPMVLEDHADRALTVAAKMQSKLLELRKKWVSEGDKWPEIVKEMRMRIGINSGEIVTGNMGSRDRMNYTMMGDSVNLAARLEEAAKQYGIFTQISHFTKALCDESKFVLRELDTIQVVGKKEPVTTYELMGMKEDIDDVCVRLQSTFHAALDSYKKMQWDAAIAAFESSLEIEYERFPELKGKKTNPSEVYIERCKMFKENPPPNDWDGVYTLTSK